MEDVWLGRAKRILALATTGKGFSKDPFDIERYDELAIIASEMLADLAGVPLQRVLDLGPGYVAAYATPSLDIRAALIENGQILLVQEKSDGRWAMPGGFADIGLSAAQNAEKEFHEEAGILVSAQRLYWVLHKARHPYPPDIRDFYKLSFLMERQGTEAPMPGPETTAVQFFSPDALPPLSQTRTIRQDIDAAFAAHARPDMPARFD